MVLMLKSFSREALGKDSKHGSSAEMRARTSDSLSLAVDRADERNSEQLLRQTIGDATVGPAEAPSSSSSLNRLMSITYSP